MERLAAWADPLEAAGIPPSAAAGLSPAQWAQHVRTAWAEVSPALAVAMARRFPGAAAIKAELQRLVAQGAGDAAVQNLPEAAPLLATPAAAKANAPQLQHLAVWEPLPLLEAIELAAGPAGRHPAVLAFVMRSLQACRPEEVAFFLPQLVQVRFHLRPPGGQPLPTSQPLVGPAPIQLWWAAHAAQWRRHSGACRASCPHRPAGPPPCPHLPRPAPLPAAA